MKHYWLTKNKVTVTTKIVDGQQNDIILFFIDRDPHSAVFTTELKGGAQRYVIDYSVFINKKDGIFAVLASRLDTDEQKVLVRNLYRGIRYEI